MASWEGITEAVAAGITGASIAGMWAKRRFRKAVQDIVSESINDVIRRQVQFERRQGRHLDRQDEKLDRIEKLIASWQP